MRIDQCCPLEVGDRVRRILPGGRGNQYGRVLAIEGVRVRIALYASSGGGEVTCRANQVAFEPLPRTIQARCRAVRRMERMRAEG